MQEHHQRHFYAPPVQVFYKADPVLTKKFQYKYIHLSYVFVDVHILCLLMIVLPLQLFRAILILVYCNTDQFVQIKAVNFVLFFCINYSLLSYNVYCHTAVCILYCSIYVYD